MIKKCCICFKPMSFTRKDHYIYGDWFVVKDELWKKISKEHCKDIICRKCFEEALGREITLEDLKYYPINYPIIVGWYKEGKLTKEQAKKIILNFSKEQLSALSKSKSVICSIEELVEEALDTLK